MTHEAPAREKSLFLDAMTICVAAAALALAGIRIVEFVERRNPSTLQVTDTTRIADHTAFAEGYRIGPSEAPVTIVEFGDYRCPFCKSAEPYLRRAIAKHEPRVALVYRHYPSGSDSYLASVAATCAGVQGRFDVMHHLLFSQSDSIGLKPLAQFAIDAGVDDTLAFNECMSSEDSDRAVARDTIAATSLGATGVPIFLINDLMVRGFHGETVMDDLVAEALRGAR